MSEPETVGIIRRLSRSSTCGTFDQKTDCIAYNYANRKLSKQLKERVEDEPFMKVDLPGSGRWLDIYLPVKGSSARFYLATVDLHRLGRSVKTKRQQGKLKTLYVVGEVNVGQDQRQ